MPKHDYFTIHWDGETTVGGAKRGKKIVLSLTKRRERRQSAERLAKRNAPALVRRHQGGVVTETWEVRK